MFEFFEYSGATEVNKFYLSAADVEHYLKRGDLYSIADMDTEKLLYANSDTSPR